MKKVGLDLDALRKKLDKSLRKKTDKKKDFGPSVWFFPEANEPGNPTGFRLVSWADHPEMPIKELAFYYGVRPLEEAYGKKQKIKPLLTLRQFGEEDPIQEAIDNLRSKENKTPEECKADEEMAKKLYPTNVYYFLGLVRGKEEEGLKIWQTQSKKIYQKIVGALLNQAKWGNIMDLDEGRDMEIHFDPTKERDKTDVDFAIEKTSAWNDKEQLEEWLSLEKMPDPLKLLSKRKKSYDDLKKVFDTWLSEGSMSVEDEEDEHEPEVETKTVAKTEVKKETAKKKNVREAFAELESNDDDE